MSLIILESDLKKFSKRANPEYVAALLGGMELLREAGILENEQRLSHFMGQVGAETGGFTVIRESLNYMTAKRLREVWPARFRNKSDIELQPLLKNPIKLGDEVYGGRMGNSHPGDGYTFRGGGFLQTTGRAAVVQYCKACGVPFRPDVLDDISLSLRFAVEEWTKAKCNDFADQNDLMKVSRAINVGSASSNVIPVEMKSREEWFAKAWAIWGSKGKADKPPKEPISPAKVLTAAATTATVASVTVQPVAEVVKQAAPVAKPVLETAATAIKQGQDVQGLITQAKGLTTFAAAEPFWVAAAAGGFGLIMAFGWIHKRLLS
jgi:putative chitinase